MPITNALPHNDRAKAVLDGIASSMLLGTQGDARRIGIMGHSRGGCTAIVKAALDPRLKCLVTWASPAALGRYSDEVLRQWKEDGRYNFVNARTKQDMFVNYAYLEDIQANRERYSLDLAVSQLTLPYLAVHGTDDESVAVEAAHRLHSYAKSGQAELALVVKGPAKRVARPFASRMTAPRQSTHRAPPANSALNPSPLLPTVATMDSASLNPATWRICASSAFTTGRSLTLTVPPDSWILTSRSAVTSRNTEPRSAGVDETGWVATLDNCSSSLIRSCILAADFTILERKTFPRSPSSSAKSLFSISPKETTLCSGSCRSCDTTKAKSWSSLLLCSN